MHNCTDEEFKICIRNNMCFRCKEKSLYKEPKWMEQQKRKIERAKQKPLVKQKKIKEGMAFEKRVERKHNSRLSNNIYSTTKRNKTANRRIGSGSIWFMPADIVTEDALIECKERGSKTSRGVKTITIQKSQLDKVKQEAAFANKKQWYYCFGFKDSSEIYVVKDYDSELEMIQYIKQLEQKVSDLIGENIDK